MSNDEAFGVQYEQAYCYSATIQESHAFSVTPTGHSDQSHTLHHAGRIHNQSEEAFSV